MKKFIISFFSILLIALASVGGGLLLSACDNSSYSENAGEDLDNSENEEINTNATSPTNDTLWTANVNNLDTSFSGSGRSSSPYLISSAQELAGLAYNVNNGNDYSGVYFRQTVNVDLSAYWWDPIGNSSTIFFSGYYDGNNYTISGLFTQSDGDYKGLIGNMRDGGIENVGIIDSTIVGDYYTGGIVGYCDRISIDNSYFNGKVRGLGYYTGGIAGYCNKTTIIRNIYNSGSVNGGDYVGGIAGYIANRSIIDSAYNQGNIGGAYFVGCIVGYVSEQGSITKSYNTGIITGRFYLGGSVGQCYSNSDLSDLYNSGTITGNYYVGGLVGSIYPNSTISRSYNLNTISGFNYVGGIAGETLGTIVNSFNVGAVSGNGNCVGGIVGRNYSTALTSYCYWGEDCTLENAYGENDNTIENCSRLDSNDNIKSESWYTTSSNWNGTYLWNFSSTWDIIFSMNSGYPVLLSVYPLYKITWNGNATVGSLLASSYWNYAGSGGYTSASSSSYSSYTISTTGVTATSNVICNNTFSYKTPIPIRSGYTFNGWYTARSGGTKVADNAGNLVASVSGYTNSSKQWIRTSDTTLYAQWSAKTYSITYNLGGGSLSSQPTTYSVSTNRTINTPTRTGYTFTGWTVQLNLDRLIPAFVNSTTGVLEYSSSYPNSVIYELFYIVQYETYTAQLSQNVIRWRCYSPNGTYPNSGSTTSASITPNLDSYYTYLLYYQGCTNSTMPVTVSIDSSFTTQEYNFVGDMVLIANWKANVYTITLDNQGGNGGTSTIYLKYNTGWYSNSTATASISTVSVPTRAGFTFQGYYTGTNGSGIQVINSSGQINSGRTTITTSNISLYAYWEAKNLAQYDEENGYWYVEMGKYPQTKETSSSIISALETARNAGNTTGSIYKIAGQTLQCYANNGNEYAYYNGNYYKVEPIKYVLAGSYSSGYGTESSNVTAVTEKVVFASVWNDDYFGFDSNGNGLGYMNSDLWSNYINNYFQNANLQSALNSGFIAHTNNKFQYSVYKNLDGSYNGMKYLTNASGPVVSIRELDSVFGVGNYQAEFSDLVADILGNNLMYWTRDIGSNLNNAECITKFGSITQSKMQNLLGIRIAANVKTFACE